MLGRPPRFSTEMSTDKRFRGIPIVQSGTKYQTEEGFSAIKNGVSKDDALAALTTRPAKLLGVDKEVGTIEAGKSANLQILTGDPLKATTWVETVILDGDVVYERGKDRKLQHLFGKTEDK